MKCQISHHVVLKQVKDIVKVYFFISIKFSLDLVSEFTRSFKLYRRVLMEFPPLPR